MTNKELGAFIRAENKKELSFLLKILGDKGRLVWSVE